MTGPTVEDVSSPPSWEIGEFHLRPLRATDAGAWQAYLSDTRVTEHTSYPFIDAGFVEGMLARQLEGYATRTCCRWALADRSGRLVGTCGFSNWSLAHAHAELVYDLSPEVWGRGVMHGAVGAVLTWAFTRARFNRVHAYVMTSNTASIAVLERAGFAREGLLEQYRLARGVPRDFYVYAMLRSRFELPTS